MTKWRSTQFFSVFLPNKLAPFSGASLFGFSTTIFPPRHHENSAILYGWTLQEYLALSPEDYGTNYSLSKFNLVKFLIIEETRPTLRYFTLKSFVFCKSINKNMLKWFLLITSREYTLYIDWPDLQIFLVETIPCYIFHWKEKVRRCY